VGAAGLVPGAGWLVVARSGGGLGVGGVGVGAAGLVPGAGKLVVVGRVVDLRTAVARRGVTGPSPGVGVSAGVPVAGPPSGLAGGA
jgi:hypothetical protein